MTTPSEPLPGVCQPWPTEHSGRKETLQNSELDGGERRASRSGPWISKPRVPGSSGYSALVYVIKDEDGDALKHLSAEVFE